MPVEVAKCCFWALPTGGLVRQESRLPKAPCQTGPQPLNAFFADDATFGKHGNSAGLSRGLTSTLAGPCLSTSPTCAAWGHDGMIIKDAARQEELQTSFAKQARSRAKRPVHWTQPLGTRRLFSLGMGLKKPYTLARARGFVPGSRARPLSPHNPFGRSFSSLNPALSWTSAGTSPMVSTL